MPQEPKLSLQNKQAAVQLYHQISHWQTADLNQSSTRLVLAMRSVETEDNFIVVSATNKH